MEWAPPSLRHLKAPIRQVERVIGIAVGAIQVHPKKRETQRRLDQKTILASLQLKLLDRAVKTGKFREFDFLTRLQIAQEIMLSVLGAVD